MWDLSSPTRDRSRVLCSHAWEVQSRNRWNTREVPGIHSEGENLLPVEETYFGPMNFLSIRPWVFTRVCICGVALHPAPWDTPSAVNGF